MLVLVNFQNKLVQCKLLDNILDIISRIVIWNVTTEQVTLNISNSQMLGNRGS